MSFTAFSGDFSSNMFTSVENKFITKYLPQADGDAVRVYLYGLYLCSVASDFDPAACACFGTAGHPRIPARPWIKAVVTDHLFRCTPGSERVVIRVVSRFGETRTQEVAL